MTTKVFSNKPIWNKIILIMLQKSFIFYNILLFNILYISFDIWKYIKDDKYII